MPSPPLFYMATSLSSTEEVALCFNPYIHIFAWILTDYFLAFYGVLEISSEVKETEVT
jgi:hypothetical protein